MGVFDWLGPTSLTKRRGWGALPPLPAEAKAAPPLVPYGRAVPTHDPLLGAIFYPTSLGKGGRAADCNSAVAACLQAIAAAVAEPAVRVYRLVDGEKVQQDDSELGKLLERPNPHLSLDDLLGYVATCLHTQGNAYWRKLRAGHPERGNVVELWPLAPGQVEPWTDDGSTDYVTTYKYTTARGRQELLAPANVVHFRYGLDDDDYRLGYGPLKRLLEEISSDDQATRYADRLLANLAIAGLALEFEKDSRTFSQPEAEEMKARILAAYGGDNVGSAAVLSPGAKLQQLGFSPEQMDMRTLHRVPEERISAVLGVPAIVAGLGAGLDRATYANVREAREMFTEQKLLPLWAQLAATITRSLVPDFTNDPGLVVDFDTSDVRALGEDQNATATRLKTLVEAGILDVNEARAELGYAALAEPSQPTALPTAAAAASRRLTLAPATKAIEDIPPALGDMRQAREPIWFAELTTYLDGQANRTVTRLRSGAETAAELVPEVEAELLAATLDPLQRSLLAAVARVVEAELAVQFVVDDPLTGAYLTSAGQNIVGITATTRQAVVEALVAGAEAGEGIDQLARRLRALPAFGSARGRVVARTELGTSQNLAALTSYRASGVVAEVRVLDGDYDAACAAINGQTFDLDNAPPPLQHPNCTRAFAPVVMSASERAS